MSRSLPEVAGRRDLAHQAPKIRFGALGAGFAALALLSGCGGGVYLGYEYSDGGGTWDAHPSVSLASATTAAPPGGAVRLIAAASDDYGVHHVSFYLRDARGDVLLADDNAAPWEVLTTVPLNAVGAVTYVAVAFDAYGQASTPSVAQVPVVGP